LTKKFDGVIEAVRYNRNGQVALVRAYELRGVTYSDRVLLDRATLLKHLKSGKKYSIGRRKEYMGSTFELGKMVKLVSKESRDFITTSDKAPKRDNLEDTPAF